MKRLVAIAAFLAGAMPLIATELAYPVQCLLVGPSRMQIRRKKS